MTIPLYLFFVAMIGGACSAIAGVIFACCWMSHCCQPKNKRTNIPDDKWWDESDSVL